MSTNSSLSEVPLSVLLWFGAPSSLETIYFSELLIRIFEQTHKWQELKMPSDFNFFKIALWGW